MEKIGLVVESASSLKILGPVLQRAAAQYPLVVLIPRWRKGKLYDTVTPELLRQTFPALEAATIVTYEPNGLSDAARSRAVTQLCLLNPYRNHSADIPLLAQQGVAVCGLDYFINSIYVTASHDDPSRIQKSLATLKVRAVASDFWRDLEIAVQPAHRPWLNRFQSLGSPLLDAFVDSDPQRARQQLALPATQPVVSLFTPNIRDHQAYFFYGLATRYYLYHLAKVIRRYCDERGYYLVVKSRAKQWDAKPFISVAHQYVQDLPEQIYPSTSTHLLKVSHLAIHFGSMMVLEAAGAKVPSIAIAPEAVDKLHAYMRPSVRPLLKEAILANHPQSLMSFGNVSQTLSIKPTLKQFADLADRMIRTASAAEYRTFNEKFSGHQETASASERILICLKNL